MSLLFKLLARGSTVRRYQKYLFLLSIVTKMAAAGVFIFALVAIPKVYRAAVADTRSGLVSPGSAEECDLLASALLELDHGDGFVEDKAACFRFPTRYYTQPVGTPISCPRGGPGDGPADLKLEQCLSYTVVLSLLTALYVLRAVLAVASRLAKITLYEAVRNPKLVRTPAAAQLEHAEGDESGRSGCSKVSHALLTASVAPVVQMLLLVYTVSQALHPYDFLRFKDFIANNAGGSSGARFFDLSLRALDFDRLAAQGGAEPSGDPLEAPYSYVTLLALAMSAVMVFGACLCCVTPCLVWVGSWCSCANRTRRKLPTLGAWGLAIGAVVLSLHLVPIKVWLRPSLFDFSMRGLHALQLAVAVEAVVACLEGLDYLVSVVFGARCAPTEEEVLAPEQGRLIHISPRNDPEHMTAV